MVAEAGYYMTLHSDSRSWPSSQANFGQINQAMPLHSWPTGEGDSSVPHHVCSLTIAGKDCALHPGRSLPVVRLGEVAERRYQSMNIEVVHYLDDYLVI